MLLNLSHVLLQGAGHMINLECADKFNAAILKNLKKGAPPRENSTEQIEEVDVTE